MDSESNNQSLVNSAFVAMGFIAYLVVAILFESLAGTFGPVARVRNIEWIKHGLPIALSLATFFGLFLNKQAYTYADEAVTEVKKVVWPSRKDTTAMTIVCCVMVVLAGIGFGVFDVLASQLVQAFVKAKG
jgi:preprotein translocase subunit SecE